jgi:hypothetical protein
VWSAHGIGNSSRDKRENRENGGRKIGVKAKLILTSSIWLFIVTAFVNISQTTHREGGGLGDEKSRAKREGGKREKLNNVCGNWKFR